MVTIISVGGMTTIYMGSMLAFMLALTAILMSPFLIMTCGLVSPLICAGFMATCLSVCGGSLPDIMMTLVSTINFPCYLSGKMAEMTLPVHTAINNCLGLADKLSVLPEAVTDLMQTVENCVSDLLLYLPFK